MQYLLWLCVRLSVFLSVTSVLHRNDWMNFASFFGIDASSHLFYVVVRKCGYPLEVFLNSGLRKFCHGSVVDKTHQQSSLMTIPTTVGTLWLDGQPDGHTKFIILRLVVKL